MDGIDLGMEAEERQGKAISIEYPEVDFARNSALRHDLT